VTAAIDPEVAVMAEQCTARGRSGVVCAAAPLAALAGAEALRSGGNAYDAVVAAALAETVLLPPKCGLGGDLVAIAVGRPGGDASLPGAAQGAPGPPEALLAIGGAPAGLAAVARAGAWRDVGPSSVGPPAAPAGYLALAARARLPLERLAAPAIALGTEGFPWSAVNERLAVASQALVAEQNPEGTTYFPGGSPLRAGQLVRLPRLAAALTELVERGEDVMAGPLGAAIVRSVQSRRGVLTEADLLGARAEWVDCHEGRVGPLRGWATPAPTHGPSLLDATAGLVADADAGDVYRVVLAAIAARRSTLSDPSGTSMVSAVDDDGTAVVVVHSNSYPRFGSGIVVPEYDLVLANRAGRGFTPEPGHPNFPVAGRRPATTLHAWVVADIDGAPRLLGATPGGANQMPWNTQLLAQVVAGTWEPGVLVTSPRWEWLPVDDGVRVEDGFSETDLAALDAVAPRRLSTSRWGLAAAQQVVRVPRPHESRAGAADPRTVGAALGV
jgi:gamma-glutamyltranspeptidase/glutathione hydrolase